MATRASHSSPYFLRVAEARAASSASKITSLSTPFSLETASTTIRISLFTTVTSREASQWPPLTCEPCFTNLCKRHRHPLPVDLERDAGLIGRKQRARVAAAPLARRGERHEHPRAHEAREMRLRAQHPIESRRGDLERIRGGYRILDIQQGRHFPAHPLTIREPHSFGAIDEESHDGAGASRGVLELHELIAQPPDEGLDEGDEPLSQGGRHGRHKNKKGPEAQLFSLEKQKAPRGAFGSHAIGRATRPSVRYPSALHGRGPRGRALYPFPDAHQSQSRLRRHGRDSAPLAQRPDCRLRHLHDPLCAGRPADTRAAHRVGRRGAGSARKLPPG